MRKEGGAAVVTRLSERAARPPAHLILRLVVSCFGGILVSSISPHGLRGGGHSRGRRVGGLLHGRRAGLLHLLRLSGGLVFFYSVHHCNHLGFLLSLGKWGQEVTLTSPGTSKASETLQPSISDLEIAAQVKSS